MARHATITYQPALDGLRALAVVAVLLFHAEVPGVDGGYLGVSVFFTLSGFLITSLLIAEHRSDGGIGIAAFYVRRVRRLVPASVACVVGVLVLQAVTGVFDGVGELRRHALGALFQVANWVFLFGGGSYQALFDEVAGAASPLEHYWSLAIEEQFYWLWPLAFLGLARLAPGGRRRIVVTGVVTAAFAALAPIVAIVWGGDAAYWATPARMAEILVGALLAMVLADHRPSPRVAVLAPVALAVLAIAIVTFPSAGGPAFSGALPLVGVVTSALLLGLQVDGPVRTAMSARPLVWLGRVSYGVYLYHWPIYLILDADRTGLDGGPLVLVRLAVTLVVAQLSFTWFEQPLRTGARIGPRLSVVGAGAATLATAVLAVALIPASSSPYWGADAALADSVALDQVAGAALVPLVPVTTSAPTDGTTPGPVRTVPEAPAATSTTAPPASTTSPESATPDADTIDDGSTGDTVAVSRPVRILVTGDSTAEATGAGLVAWAAANPDRAQVSMHTVPGCGIVRGGQRLVQSWQDVPSGCDEWYASTLADRVAELRPDLVMFMTTTWDTLDRRWDDGVTLAPFDPPFRARIETDLAAVADDVLTAGATAVVWVLAPIPNVNWRSGGDPQEDPARHAVLRETMRALAARTAPRVATVDLPSYVTSVGLDTDRAARPDGVHWSAAASEAIATGFLGERLVRLALEAG